jgi:hypothetical protein
VLAASTVEIMSVEAGSPAAKAGVRDGDLIIGLGAAAVTSVDELVRRCAPSPPAPPPRSPGPPRPAHSSCEVTPVERPDARDRSGGGPRGA